jgi:hypothetical protein
VVWDLVTVEDFFLAAAGFGIAGSVLLAKGLFLAPKEIRKLSQAYYGGNRPQAEAMIKDKVAAEFGIGALALGFVGQVVGTLCQVGAQMQPVPPSMTRVLFGLAVVIVAFATSWIAYFPLRGWLERRQAPGEPSASA